MIRVRPVLPRLSAQVNRNCARWLANSSTMKAATGGRSGVLLHWNAEALRTTDKYPLSLELHDKVPPMSAEPTKRRAKANTNRRKSTATTSYARPQIVSPDLCDDVLKYYGKSLEIHKGCDILDINPGAGLWSRKLHDFLQPRSHVLMEPSDRYKPFLDPLVNAPGSKYKLVKKETIELSSYTELVEEGVFPEQKRVDPMDNSGQELNTTLLVTGMLVWDPVLPGMAFDSMAKQLYNHFASAVRTNDQFHAYGRVRTLFWVGADDFRPIIAESSATYQKNNCLLELTQSMDMVVNAPKRSPRKAGRGASGRESHYEIEGIVKAMQRARANGFTIPAHRQDKAQKVAAEVEEISGGSGRSSVTWLHDYLLQKHAEGETVHGLLSDAQFQLHDNFIALQKKYPDIDFAAMGNAKSATTKRVRSFWVGREDHPGREEAHSFSLFKSADRALQAKKEHIDSIADIGEELYFAEGRALRMQDGTAEKEELLKQITEMDKKWDKLYNAVAANYKAAPLTVVDDRISLRAPSHARMQWDRRPFEPLTMQVEEAWPPHGLALISTTPYPRPPGQTVDFYEWVQDFVYALFSIPSRSIPEALEGMQHGLSEIIPSCPSLTDPDKGGRMLMKHFRTRMLTSEMVDELVLAYREWPFKEPGSDHNKYFRWKGHNKSR